MKTQVLIVEVVRQVTIPKPHFLGSISEEIPETKVTIIAVLRVTN